MINADGILGDGRLGQTRFWAGLCLALVVLVACGAPESTAQAPPTEVAHPPSPTPFPAFTPAPTSETPPPTPTATPVPQIVAVELPPAPTLPLPQALAQLDGNALLYDWNGFLMLTDGQHDVWLTADEAICDHRRMDPQGATWSADGRFLAINCYHLGLENVALLDMQTGVMGLVDTGTDDLWQVIAWPDTWSPSAPTFLIYHLRADGSGRLSIVDAPTGKVETFFDHTSNQLSIAWSPDGAQVAIFTGTTFHAGKGTYELFLLNADGSNQRHFEARIVSDQCPGIEWSHDRKFIFVGGCLRIAVDTGVATSVDRLNGDRAPSDVRPSPDGAYYLSREQLDDGYEHWLLRRADSTLVRDLTDQADNGIFDIAWMPDSKHIIGAGQNDKLEGNVVIVDLTGRTKTLLAFPYSLNTTPSSSILGIAPDGSTIAVNLANGIALLDLQGQELATIPGWLIGWRPHD